MTTKTVTTDRPITLHGLCHMSDSFCDGMELCSLLNCIPESGSTAAVAPPSFRPSKPALCGSCTLVAPY